MRKKKIDEKELEEFAIDASQHKTVSIGHTEEKKKEESNKSRKLTFYLLLALSLLFTILFIFKKYNNSVLENNGIETKAIVESIVKNNYRASDMDGKWVHTYLIKYRFGTKMNNEISGYYEIQRSDYEKYFEKELKVNDTISIIYLPDQPKKNKIKKLN